MPILRTDLTMRCKPCPIWVRAAALAQAVWIAMARKFWARKTGLGACVPDIEPIYW